MRSPTLCRLLWAGVLAVGSVACSDSSGPANVAVELIDFGIDAPSTVSAGSISFDLRNTGTFTHELLILDAERLDVLPRTDKGAVDETGLGAEAILARSEVVFPGAAASVSADLDPGSYVLICNIESEFSNDSHPALGMHTVLTVE